nr:hypothetical protein [Tanacetum cinerariifolium]
MCEDDIQNEQNDVESDDERVALANLIANLKLNVDENKKIQKQLKKANTTLAQELKECKTKQAEFEKYKAFNERTINYEKLERKLNDALGQLAHKDTGDSLKFVHELKQEMHADLKYIESLEKEIDELGYQKAEFSDMHDVILHDCVSKDVMLSKQTESVSKKVHTKLLQRFAQLEKHSISLEIALKKGKEQAKYVDTKFDRPSVVRQPNAQRIPKPSILGKPTPFSNFLDRIYFQKTRLVSKANVSEGLSKPVTTQTLPQASKKTVSNTNVLKPRMYRIDNRTAHTRAPQLPQTVRNTNPRVSTSTGVNHKPTVSRPQLKSNQSKDKVLPNNSQMKAKKTQVEVHPRIPSISNKMKSVTACKVSLNSRTLNPNAVCATCNKCLVDSNHFAYVTKMLNDVHARTKKPTVVHSKGYRFYNKITRMIVESIHIFFDEIKEVSETSVANNTSSLVPQRQKASDYDNPDLVPQRKDVYSSADADVPSQQELNLLFGPLYDEFFNAGSNPSTNVQSTCNTPKMAHSRI